jgi:hypothetical protein
MDLGFGPDEWLGVGIAGFSEVIDVLPAVRKLQISLGTLQRLDRGLLIDADDDRVLGRRHVQADHVGGLGGELRFVALAPGFAPGEVDLLGAQEAPDILDIDIAEPRGQQRSGPAGVALGRPLVQQRQDPFTRLRRVLRLGAPLTRLVETREPPFRIAHAPLGSRTGRASDFPPDRPAGHPAGRRQHDPCPLPQTVLRLRRTRQALKLRALRRRQNNSCRFRDAAHASLNHDSTISDSRH